jgi:hypothetical protein
VHLLEQDLTPSKLQSFPFISFASDALASLSNSIMARDQKKLELTSQLTLTLLFFGLNSNSANFGLLEKS